ncbi:probable ATP-dependent RNA helicase DDX49 [Periophthalmus magnuspinnatus]|uniref:probable ATP-dependent RNA helicase DDX49 n=1 Tax=Periophthalmus magnuspinnatus TaxID=409849 RepID=UPI002436E8D0|nr:probable ATP-dependent RNA helicase DDX49 [Periophthalmus magnuspinnatus]
MPGDDKDTPPRCRPDEVGRTARAGRNGVSITLVTQYDIHLVHAIEQHTQTKLKEYPVDEKEVNKILTQVNVTRRQCEIKLEASDFDEKKEINKRKQLILEGKDPDLEAKRKAELEKIRSKKKKFKEKIQETMEKQRKAQVKQSIRKRRDRQKKAKTKAAK